MSAELGIIRQEIDKIDDEIKNLLVARMELMPKVAKIKVENGMEMHQPEREKQVYESIKEFAEKTGIDGQLLSEIYKLLMAKSVEIEEEVAREIYEKNQMQKK